MPSIQVDLSYFLSLANLPLPELMLRIFLDGGWIFIAWIALLMLWHVWVDSRQAKFAAAQSYVVLAIDVPPANEQTPKAVEQIFVQLASTYSGLSAYNKYWEGKTQLKFSFELVSIDGYVQFLVRTPKKFRDLVEAAFYAQYPDAEIIEVADYADKVPLTYPHPEYQAFGTEYVLKKPGYMPLKTYLQFEHTLSGDQYFKDPISAFLESLSLLRRGEQLWIQFLLTPTGEEWKKEGEGWLAKMLGRTVPEAPKGVLAEIMQFPFTVLGELGLAMFKEPEAKKGDDTKVQKLSPGEKDTVEQVERKLQKPAFAAKIRVIYVAQRGVFSQGRMAGVKAALNQFGAGNINSFKGYGDVTPQTDWFWQRWEADQKRTAVVRNYKNRSGNGAPPFILGSEELATLYHFPAMQVKAPLVKKTDAKRAEPPGALPTEEYQENPFRRGFAPLPPAEAPKAELPPEPLPAAPPSPAPVETPSPASLDADESDEVPPNLPFG